MKVGQFHAHAIVRLMGAATVLLFAVGFTRIGVERLWSGGMCSSPNERSSIGGLLAKGTGLGLPMQGATAVLVMTTGLAGSGTIPVMSAAVISVGPDLASALAVLFLHLPVSDIGPLAVLVGGSLCLRSAHPRTRNDDAEAVLSNEEGTLADAITLRAVRPATEG